MTCYSTGQDKTGYDSVVYPVYYIRAVALDRASLIVNYSRL